jgi:hypothetical protein
MANAMETGQGVEGAEPAGGGQPTDVSGRDTRPVLLWDSPTMRPGEKSVWGDPAAHAVDRQPGIVKINGVATIVGRQGVKPSAAEETADPGADAGTAESPAGGEQWSSSGLFDGLEPVDHEAVVGTELGWDPSVPPTSSRMERPDRAGVVGSRGRDGDMYGPDMNRGGAREGGDSDGNGR